jgi:hypothetical protein
VFTDEDVPQMKEPGVAELVLAACRQVRLSEWFGQYVEASVFERQWCHRRVACAAIIGHPLIRRRGLCACIDSRSGWPSY